MTFRGLVLFALLAGCTGQIDRDRSGAEESPAAPGDPARGAPDGIAPTPTVGVTGPRTTAAAPAPARIRRLTATELKNSVSDVFLAGGAIDGAFQTEVGSHDFENVFDGLNVSIKFAEQLEPFAEQVASKAVARLEALVPCSAKITAAAEAPCAETFVETVGLRAYRRPVTGAEKQILLDVFAGARRNGTFAEAIGSVVEAMVQSPNFLFRTEYGGAPGPSGVASLTPYEVAAALSYGLWQTTPDAALLEAARTGKLASRADVQAAAKRLLDDARAKRGVVDFFQQWLETKQAPTLSKADPAFTTALAEAAAAETGRFVESVVFGGDGRLETLLTATSSFANADLAKIYGLAGPRGAALEPVTLDRGKRAGLLTQPAFMMVHSSPSTPSPIFLGHFVRTRLFCQPLQLPTGVEIPSPSKDPNMSTRQRFDLHSSSPACSGCHRLLDPIGYGFERYDLLGRYRESETAGKNSYPLTGKGELVGTDVDGPFEGPVELARKLASSAEVRDCFVGNLLKYLLGRDTAQKNARIAADAEVIAAVAKGGAIGVREMLLALVGSDAFLMRDTSALPKP